MTTLKSLMAQKAHLEKQIDTQRRAERTKVIDEIKALMVLHGLTADDFGGSRRGAKGGKSLKGRKVAIKYRNTTTGDSWSGRGLQPRWLKAALKEGMKIEDFAV